MRNADYNPIVYASVDPQAYLVSGSDVVALVEYDVVQTKVQTWPHLPSQAVTSELHPTTSFDTFLMFVHLYRLPANT